MTATLTQTDVTGLKPGDKVTVVDSFGAITTGALRYDDGGALVIGASLTLVYSDGTPSLRLVSLTVESQAVLPTVAGALIYLDGQVDPKTPYTGVLVLDSKAAWWPIDPASGLLGKSFPPTSLLGDWHEVTTTRKDAPDATATDPASTV
jgi:hypothetical protein